MKDNMSASEAFLGEDIIRFIAFGMRTYPINTQGADLRESFVVA